MKSSNYADDNVLPAAPANVVEMIKALKTGQMRLLSKGPSKNYVTAREGEGVDDFVTYRYVYLRGRGVFHEIIT